ncbi:hypothetical protein ZWY2020_004687 [Hordeum vulgare]|nr:hypothetical protein ZWY2020_004687 [Hordeum vulgare]
MADVNVPFLGGLAARYPGRFCRHADSLLLVQVNEFTCGVHGHGDVEPHADGRQGHDAVPGAVGELAHWASLAPSVMPFHADDGSLPQLLSSIVAAQKPGAAPSSLPPASATRAWFSKPSQRWQCRTRAAVVSVYDEAPVTLSFAANMRRLIGARPGYYGKQHSDVVAVIMEVPWKLVVTEQRISSSVQTNSSRFLFRIQDKPLDKIYSRLAVAGIHEQNWKWAQHISPTRFCPLVGEDICFGASHCREFLTFLLREFLTLLHCMGSCPVYVRKCMYY